MINKFLGYFKLALHEIKTNKTPSKSTERILGAVFVSILIISVFKLRACNQERNENIMNNGIDGIAIVIDKGETNNRGRASTLWVRYEFESNGKMQSSMAYVDAWEHEEAIIGMKYKLLYVPGNQHDSKIYLREPIENEYKNVIKERERIFKENPNTENKARSIEELQIYYPQIFKKDSIIINK